MADLFASPRLADLVLAMLALEAVVFALRGGRTALARVGPSLLSGACLALALRAVMSGAAWPWVATGLLGALGAHLWDLRARGT